MTAKTHVKNGINPRQIWARILAGAALAAFPALLPAQVSLATVVDLAQRNSSSVKLAGADVQKAKSALAQIQGAFMPDLEFGSGLPAAPSVGFTGNPPSIFNATMQSLVLSIPQRQYLKAAHSGIKAAYLSLKDAREHVALDASTAYIELDTVTREMDATREQETLAGRLVDIEQQRTEAGVDPASELLQARLTAAQIRLKRIHLEARAASLAKQISVLTGLPAGSIAPDHASIPEIPAVTADPSPRTLPGIEAAQMLTRAKLQTAKGDTQHMLLPEISFTAQYARDTTLLNNANSYFAKPLKSDNFTSGFSVQIPLFDLGHRAKEKQSAADALRARVEAEQAQRQNEVQIALLSGVLRELDAQAEIASLKQQIANEQLRSVLAELELGNGVASGPGAPPQLAPKSEQLARIDERQKLLDSMDAGFDLAKARLSLLCALGHMEDWLNELHTK